MLAAKTVLLVGEVVVHVLLTASARAMRLHVVHVVREQLLLVHLDQLVEGKLQVRHKSVATRAREVFTHDNTHHAQVLRMRRHGVRWHDPAALAQLVGDGELIEVVLARRVEAEGNERQAFAAGLRHEQEAHGLHGGGEVVGGAGQVQHDAAVAGFTQADQLVVLRDDLASASREVQRERRLVGAEVVDVEDEFFGEELGVAPDDPADAGVDEAVLVTGDVDGDDL